jgi:hypothetical protein
MSHLANGRRLAVAGQLTRTPAGVKTGTGG